MQTKSCNGCIALIIVCSQLCQIKLENRFKYRQPGDQAFITVDCTDCLIEEPSPFNSIYYSHKWNHPAYKYEIGISIRGGDIVWVNGPWPAGVPDSKVFDLVLSKRLGKNEKAECDNGYGNLEKAVIPGNAKSYLHKKQKSQARGRHENFNGKFKVFNALDHRFRHNDEEEHFLMFHSIAILVQLSQEHGEKIYGVEVNGNYLT